MKPDGSSVVRRRLFGTGHFAKSIVWSFCDLLMIYYLHSRLGLSGTVLALVTVPAFVLSGMMDVVLGWLLCRISPRRIIIIQAIGAAATGVGVVALFRFSSGDNAAMLLTMIGFRVAYAVYDVTQNALTSLLPVGDADANRYVMLRATLSSAARLVVAGAAILLVGDAAPLAGWEAMAILPAAILVMASSLAMTRVSLPTAAITSELFPTISALPCGIAPLLVAAFFHAAALSMAARFVPFIANGQILLFVFVAGTLVGPVVASRLMTGLGRSGGIATLTTLTVAGLIGLAPPARLVTEATSIAVHGIGVGGTGMLLWRDMSLIVRRHARCTDERGDLLAFALLTGAIKVGIAVSAATIAWLVDAGGDAHRLQLITGIAVIGGLAYVAAMRSGDMREYENRRVALA